ncbi:MAG: integration host factor subunit alpha [Pseudomonadota bacterium]|nr:integration host factor subunit alpha [Pseudomonadota bacterium]
MSETLTKQKIAESICMTTGLSKVDSEKIVEQTFMAIINTLGRGEVVKISGFGNFDLLDKAERPGRNPRTGKPTPISKRRVVTFRAGNKLKSRIERYDGSKHTKEDTKD